jgi:hypothetical protein
MTTPAAENSWAELVQAEIATAEGPASADSFCRVAAAYEAADFPNVALAVLRKADSFGIEKNHAILPALLRGLRKQRQFAELNTALQAGLAINDREAGLRRELALALACLSQIPAAEMEWASLIRTGCMNETDWLSCATFVANCPDAPALVQMMTAISERQELRAHPLAGFCTVKHLIDRDLAAAQRILLEVDPARASAGDADILLHLAILAWRLRDYAKAEKAATLAATSSNDPSISRRIVASIRSFAGDFSHLRKVSLPAVREAGEWVSNLAQTVKRDGAGWGFLHRHGPESLEGQVLDLTAEPEMVIPEELDPVASFSILSEDLRPDPFHILLGVDFSWPHVLLQRKPDGDALHFFVGARGHKDWLWEEIRPEAGDDHNNPDFARRRQPSATWAEAMRELGKEADEEP